MIDGKTTAEMLEYVAAAVISRKMLLTDADKLGDADHGVGMARGFEAVLEKLPGIDQEQPWEILRITGLTLMSKVGGAAGAICWTVMAFTSFLKRD